LTPLPTGPVAATALASVPVDGRLRPGMIPRHGRRLMENAG
jgi:hypothetical protein